MLSESLHPNRLVAGSFASPSRDLLQIGFRLYPLPNNAITGKARDIGFIQRNGWFGRSYRQTVKLSDFVSHPGISIRRYPGEKACCRGSDQQAESKSQSYAVRFGYEKAYSDQYSISFHLFVYRQGILPVPGKPRGRYGKQIIICHGTR